MAADYVHTQTHTHTHTHTPPRLCVCRAAQEKKADKKGRKRNLTLLSFGEDAEADEAQIQQMGRRWGGALGGGRWG